jgi:hypothetical protein
MAVDDDNPPLASDPAREAVASMRGYWAQVWRSVLVWMELGDKDCLYLEGAEDIDRVSGLTAETTQVKDVRGKITLRSGDVIEAIDNAWTHRQRNPSRSIRFRFLTTSSIGVELGAPFGNGVGGLDLWRRARWSRDEAQRQKDVRAIVNFLLADGKVSAPVRKFLQEASNAEIWQKLIAMVEWDTEAEQAPEVIREIEELLVYLGEKKGVPADKSEEVAADLCQIAFETATREKDRFLTRADLLRVFDERTQVSIPAATLYALLRLIPQHLVKPGVDAVFPQAVGGMHSTVGGSPRLPQRYYRRSAVLAEIDRRLARYPILALLGSTGIGKSIAAAGHVASSALSWGWVDLRGADSAALKGRLDCVVDELRAESGLTHVVLDDIAFPPDPRPLEAPLTQIKAILADRGGHLVITSAAALPRRLVHALALPDDGIFTIPAFSPEEIAEFLTARGCPDPEVARLRARFIAIETSGHAQLVHARIAALEAQGFPTPDLESLKATPPDMIEARTEALKLIATFGSSTRELIYRLSLTRQALTRHQVLAIACQPAPIGEPGLVFEGLIGPWVEVVADKCYRISPLLHDVGKDVLGEEWATEMHRDIVRALLRFPTLSPTDVSAILFHGIAGRDWFSVARLSLGILRSDEDTWEALTKSAGWFVSVGTDMATTRPEGDSFTLCLVRLLQFRLAAAAKNDGGAREIITCMDKELPADVAGVPLRRVRHLFLAQVLLRTEVNLPIAQLVSIGLEYIRLTDELAQMLPKARGPESDPVLTGPDGAADMASVAGFSLMPHLVSVQALRRLVDACEPLDPIEVRRLLWFVGGQESTAHIVFERIWLAELNAAMPDWLSAREVLRRAYELGRRCNLPELAQGAARTIARITDENLKDPAEALRLADAMAAEIGWSPGQEDGRAAILLGKGEAAEALAIWRRLLPNWRPKGKFDLRQPFSHRSAAIAAARLNEWREAADWLKSAHRLAGATNQAIYCAGLLVDEGYARWKVGDNGAALACLVEGLRAIDQLAPDETGDNINLLRTRAFQTLTWLVNTTAGKQSANSEEPPPAYCTNWEPVKAAGLPSMPSDFMWMKLLEFEFLGDLGSTQFHAHKARLKNSSYGSVRLSFNHLRLQRRLQTAALDDLPEVVADWTESLAVYHRYYKQDGLKDAEPLPASVTPLDRGKLDAELVLSGMLYGIFVLAARERITEQVLELWSTSAARAGLSVTLGPWLTFVGDLFISNKVDAEKVVRDPQRSWPWQGSALVKIAIDGATRPAELLTAHDCWIHEQARVALEPYVLGDVELLVTSGWRRMSERPFLLRAPSVTVPRLLEACASESTGWRKIGEVLAAACDAVPEAVPATLREKFRALQK